MKILYAIQATGNGHISRAMELLPYLKKYGSVDLFLSGENATLPLQESVKYQSKGLSMFYSKAGGVNYWKTLQKISPYRLLREVNDLPVEKYDLILNDFECITALACARKKVPSISFGHQASFFSAKTPRPDKINKTGEWILKNYARASSYIGIHFEPYDNFIYRPVIKNEILKASPSDAGHITVYLPSYNDETISGIFNRYPTLQFHIFSREVSKVTRVKNLLFIPVNKETFNQSLITCNSVITGAGFETPAEAIFLGKKLLAIPIKGQYEQQCNAAALTKMGIQTLSNLESEAGLKTLENWFNSSKIIRQQAPHSAKSMVEILMQSVFN